MNWILNAFLILVLSILISAISYYVFGVKSPWGSFWIKALVLFLFLLVVSLWLKPVGPEWRGIQYVSLIISALLFILFAASLTSLTDQSPKIPTKWSTMEKRRFIHRYFNEQRRVIFSMSLMFWLLLSLLIFLIVAGYYFK